MGLEEALSVKLRVAERAPSDVGVKSRFKVVLDPAATVIGNATVPYEKSPAFAPENRNAETERADVPGFEIVSV